MEMALAEVEEWQIDMEFQGWDCLSFKVADTSTSMVREYVQIPGVEEWQIDMESQCFIPWTCTLLIMITTHKKVMINGVLGVCMGTLP